MISSKERRYLLITGGMLGCGAVMYVWLATLLFSWAAVGFTLLSLLALITGLCATLMLWVASA